MGNILNYVKKYGAKTFEEEPINRIDEVIFSIISYIDFDGIVEDKPKEKVRLADAADLFFEKYTKKDINKNVLGIQVAIKIFSAIRNTSRYQDMLLYNYSYKRNNSQQFSAIFINVDSEYTYISFEGTDELVSGWKEDFEMSYKFPIASQKDAIRYLNRRVKLFSRRKYVICGHSKGGNLALVAAMYANPLIRRRIVKVISHDGPGLKNRQFMSRQYRRIKPIYNLIIPNYSVVGLLLRHDTDYQVILSNKNGIMAHNVLSWQTSDNDFVSSHLSSYSTKIDEIISSWLDKYNDEEREAFVKEVFAVFKRANIDSLVDIKESALPNIINIIHETKYLNKETRTMIHELVLFFIDYIKRDATSFFHSKFSNH